MEIFYNYEKSVRRGKKLSQMEIPKLEGRAKWIANLATKEAGDDGEAIEEGEDGIVKL